MILHGLPTVKLLYESILLNTKVEIKMNEKILVIDDEREIRDLLADLLEDEGYEVFQAENGVDGLEVFKNVKPDLVLTDVRMPHKTGIDVLRDIRESGSTDADVDVIILTGQSDEATAIDCLRAGAYDYLLKPIEEIDVLLTAINRALEKRNLQKKNKMLTKQLKELIPICSFCRKLRHDDGSWYVLEKYLTKETDSKLSHGVCPDCLQKEYPELNHKG